MVKVLEFLARMAAAEEKAAHQLERQAVALERLSAANWGLGLADSKRSVAGRGRETNQMRAMRLLHELGPDNLTEIADRVNVHRRTLNKWPVFMEAVERMRAADQWVPRDPRAIGQDEL